MIFIVLNSSHTTYKPEKIESGSSENQQQKKHFANAQQKRCSWKLCNIHRKTPVPKPLFNKVAYPSLQFC